MVIYYTGDFAGGRTESRRFLKSAITEYTGDESLSGDLVSGIKTGEHGKPFIDGFDRFSVSHTGGIWAVFIGGSECGLDIQLGRECDIKAISRRIYASEDAEVLARMTEEDPSKARDVFFRLWTRREALAKAMGGTVYDTSLPSVRPDEIAFCGKSYKLLDIAFPAGAAPDGAKLYAAVCAEDDGKDPLRGIAFHLLVRKLNEG